MAERSPRVTDTLYLGATPPSDEELNPFAIPLGPFARSATGRKTTAKRKGDTRRDLKARVGPGEGGISAPREGYTRRAEEAVMRAIPELAPVVRGFEGLTGAAEFEDALARGIRQAARGDAYVDPTSGRSLEDLQNEDAVLLAIYGGAEALPFAAKPLKAVGRGVVRAGRAITPRAVREGVSDLAARAGRYLTEARPLDDADYIEGVARELPEEMGAFAVRPQGQRQIATTYREPMALPAPPRAVPAEAAAPSAAAPEGIIAYHGSPHTFDRFDISKIGTGEGAQAYGRGLYFAEAEPVAAEYRQRLAEVTAAPFDVIGIPPKEWNAALMFARQMDPSLPDVAARDFAQWVGRDVTPELVDAFRASRKPGSMYEVNLAVRPEDMLDWDAEFTPEQLESFAAKFDTTSPPTRRLLEDWAYVNAQRGQPMPAGEDIMRQLSQGNISSRELSQMLAESGVPGVRYLDQGSRSAGEGTRNYVMFSDEPISILRRYRKGGLAVKRKKRKAR